MREERIKNNVHCEDEGNGVKIKMHIQSNESTATQYMLSSTSQFPFLFDV
jgi:hypothetical protein